ncbi:MAG: hypothetical protein ABS34_13805 [Opitutaceae bacterium BACL24 MAG-120322-bin51]|jgi:hypothetical protein|nr:MAG: hypothetical protein ABS34_13805 [Opitutaceae bacterium BACL24 MAG-120322-bin51]
MAFDNTYTGPPTGSASGNREQLLDMTTVLAPRQAPVYGLLPKQSATADLVEWTVDNLRTPTKDNAVAEGANVGETNGDSFIGQFGSLTRLNNRLQHFRETFNVSKKQEVMDSVTPVRIQAAEEKAASQLLRDIETSICSDNVAVTGNGTTPGKFRGLGEWINDAPTADDVQAIPVAFRTKAEAILDAAGEELTESRFNGMLTAIFEETGEQQDLVLVAGTQVRNSIIDGFTRVKTGATASYSSGNNTTFNQGDGTEVNYNVEIFQGPFGIVKIVSANPKCLVDQKRAYLLDPSLLGYAEALSIGSTMLEDQGGGPRGYIDAMGTLLVKGSNGLGKITDFAI